jgi:hypothetical protein
MMRFTNQKKKQTSWDKLKQDPVKMKNYQIWRRQYLRKKKQVLISKESVHDISIRYNGVIYDNLTDLLLNLLLVVDSQDDGILHIWKHLKAITKTKELKARVSDTMKNYQNLKQYNLRKKGQKCDDMSIQYTGELFEMIDLLLTVDLEDKEIVVIWKALQNMTKAVYRKRSA